MAARRREMVRAVPRNLETTRVVLKNRGTTRTIPRNLARTRGLLADRIAREQAGMVSRMVNRARDLPVKAGHDQRIQVALKGM